MNTLTLERLKREVANHELFQTAGKLRSAAGLLLTCHIPATVGDQCEILTSEERPLLAEVIGFTGGVAHLIPYDSVADVRPGMRVICKGRRLSIPAGKALLGRVLDGLGRPIDGKGP